MSDSGGGPFLVIVLFILFGLVSGFIAEFLARRTRFIAVPLSRAEVLDRANSWFGRIAWADTDGPGDINERRRTASTRRTYTISISVDAAGEDRSEAELWLSAAERAFAGLLVNAAGPAFQLARLQRRLRALGETPRSGEATGAATTDQLTE